jgi:hypothetical protein
MERFEYCVYIHDVIIDFCEISEDTLQSILNQYGADGWELVSNIPFRQVSGVTHEIICTFKRKVSS